MKTARMISLLLLWCVAFEASAQTNTLQWNDVSDQFGVLPNSIKVFASEKIFDAFYGNSTLLL
jgi:hypothetical protein